MDGIKEDRMAGWMDGRMMDRQMERRMEVWIDAGRGGWMDVIKK